MQSMLCPHCSTSICPNDIEKSKIYRDDCFIEPIKNEDKIGEHQYPGYFISQSSCPICKKLIIFLHRIYGDTTRRENNLDIPNDIREKISDERLFPLFVNKEGFDEVPEHIKKDYQEAVAILNLSPKSSAALCRRIVQAVL